MEMQPLGGISNLFGHFPKEFIKMNHSGLHRSTTGIIKRSLALPLQSVVFLYIVKSSVKIVKAPCVVDTSFKL